MADTMLDTKKQIQRQIYLATIRVNISIELLAWIPPFPFVNKNRYNL